MTWPFGELRPLSYDVIMIDPPWDYENWSEKGEGKNAKSHYNCLPIDEICALPVSQLARGDCWLWLWATWPMLPQAQLAMKEWGFEYCTGGPWVKRGKSGKLSFGPGYVLRTCGEVFLLGKIGQPKVLHKRQRNIIEAPRRRHSEKPDEAYEVCEKLFPAVKRADLFSRTDRPGWEAWGDQSGTFNKA